MIVAELRKWNGEVVQCEIKREWIDDIVSAVVGQYFYANNKENFGINGGDFAHVDVYEVKDEPKNDAHKPCTEEEIPNNDIQSVDGLPERTAETESG